MIEYIKALRVQFFVIALLFIFYLLQFLEVLPDMSSLEATLSELMALYGVVFLFALSFVENIPGLNIYFPGSIAILLGMSNTSGNLSQGFFAFSSILLAAILANAINIYFSNKVEKKSAEKIFLVETVLALWHPHFASIFALRVGKLSNAWSFFVFKFIPVTTCWYIIWAVLMYNIGSTISMSSMLMNVVFFIYLGAWLINDSIKYFNKNPA